MSSRPALPGLTRTLLRARQRSTPSSSSSSSYLFTDRSRTYHPVSYRHRSDRVEYHSTGLRLAPGNLPTSSNGGRWAKMDGSIRGYATDRDPGGPGAPDPKPSSSKSSSNTDDASVATSTSRSSLEEPVIPDILSDGQPFLPPATHAGTSNYAPFIRRLLARLPHPTKSPHPNPTSGSTSSSSPSHSQSHPNDSNTHGANHHDHHHHQYGPHFRPTKDQLLAATTSFWQRLRIRWKWFSIRSWRRFNIDDWTAFGSWVLVGNSEYS